MTCYFPLKGFVSLESGGITFKPGGGGGKMEVACGQCLGCRIDRSQMWAMRIVHEATLYDDNCFITLTYREKQKCTEQQLEDGFYLPSDGSLVKKHYQDFIKRLRKRFNNRRIRYYHCGEYGDKLNRPHYHACLFNLHFRDKELFKEDEGYFLFTSKTLDDLWPYGFSTVAELNFETAAYTARYIMKKVTGDRAQDHYLRWDEYGVCYWLLPEYTTMSNGIGADWFEAFKDDVFPSDEVPVPGRGIFKKVPRYYEERLDNTEMLEEVKRLRKEFYFAHGEEYTPERLMDKLKVKEAEVSMLTRSL